MSDETSSTSIDIKFADLLEEGVQRFAHMLRRLIGALPFTRDVAQAEHEFVSASDHKTAAGYLERGREYYNKKKFKKAKHCFDKATRYDSQYALAHYYRGLALFKQGQRNSAITAWNHAVASDPESDAAIKAQSKLKGIKPDKIFMPGDEEW